jgi:hypothetical protein
MIAQIVALFKQRGAELISTCGTTSAIVKATSNVVYISDILGLIKCDFDRPVIANMNYHCALILALFQRSAELISNYVCRRYQAILYSYLTSGFDKV